MNHIKQSSLQRKAALGTLAVLGATTLGGVAVQPAHADADTWKKIAIGAGVVAGYGLLKDNGKLATIGGIAAAGSYLKYRSDKKQEEKEAEERRNARRYYNYRHNRR